MLPESSLARLRKQKGKTTGEVRKVVLECGEKVKGDPSASISSFFMPICLLVCVYIHLFSKHWTLTMGQRHCARLWEYKDNIKINKTQPLPLRSISPSICVWIDYVIKSLQNRVIRAVIKICRWYPAGRKEATVSSAWVGGARKEDFIKVMLPLGLSFEEQVARSSLLFVWSWASYNE